MWKSETSERERKRDIERQNCRQLIVIEHEWGGVGDEADRAFMA